MSVLTPSLTGSLSIQLGGDSINGMDFLFWCGLYYQLDDGNLAFGFKLKGVTTGLDESNP